MSNILLGAFLAILSLAITNFTGEPVCEAERLLRIASFWGILWLGVVGLEAIYRHHTGA